MNTLLQAFRALCGHGVTLRVDQAQKLHIQGDRAFLESADLSVIRDNRALMINTLPCGQNIPAKAMTEAIEASIERAAIQEYDGHMSRVDADGHALFALRGYLLQSL